MALVRRDQRIARITQHLRKLPLDKLHRARDFIAFLATTDLNTRKPDTTKKEAPKKEAPKKEAPKQETLQTELSPEEETALQGMSLTWLLRLAMGTFQFPEGEPIAEEPSFKRLKDVPLEGQEQNLWCWAGAAQMIMAYQGKRVTQLELAKSVVRPRTGVEGDLRFNRGGWPPFNRQWGFDADQLSGGRVLTAEQAQADIDAQRPFAISWRYPDGGGHMLVITGYLWIDQELWLVAQDPWPPGQFIDQPPGVQGGGDRSLISYEHYVKGHAGSWKTYYNIRPTASAQRGGR